MSCTRAEMYLAATPTAQMYLASTGPQILPPEKKTLLPTVSQGEYAYCKVVKEMIRSKAVHFRVLALSATPGTDINAVKMVIQNLLISKIELRHEESPDIMPYTHQVHECTE